MNRSKLQKKSGYLLIEAMVAMGVLTTSVLGIFALMSQSVKLTRVVNDQYVGTYLAAEGIELAKNLLDANFAPLGTGFWNAGGFAAPNCYEIDVNTVALPGPGCSDRKLGFDASIPLYAYGAASSTPFARSVSITPIVDMSGVQEGVQVVSTVTWADGSSSVVLEDKFYNWHTGGGGAPSPPSPPASPSPITSFTFTEPVAYNAGTGLYTMAWNQVGYDAASGAIHFSCVGWGGGPIPLINGTYAITAAGLTSRGGIPLFPGDVCNVTMRNMSTGDILDTVSFTIQ